MYAYRTTRFDYPVGLGGWFSKGHHWNSSACVSWQNTHTENVYLLSTRNAKFPTNTNNKRGSRYAASKAAAPPAAVAGRSLSWPIAPTHSNVP